MHIRAYAKINPFLDITSRRDDSYHELSIVFRPVSIFDELVIKEIYDGQAKVYLTSSKKEFAGQDNIIFKAYETLKKYAKENSITSEIPSFNVHLIKRIPSGAGMAGGSTDASAFLYAANELAGLHFSISQLMEIGRRVGADVPACLLRMPSVATGIGDELKKIPEGEKVFYIVIKPDVSFNTGEMYRKYDELLADGSLNKKNKDAEKIVRAIKKGKLKSEAKALYNVFEKVVPEKKLIKKIKKSLITSGALGALLTGSGSCVYGMFESKKERDKAYKKLKKEFQEIYTCESVCEKKREKHFVYILRCEDDTLYTGWTTDLLRREKAHNGKGGAKYTKAHGGGKIVYFEEYDNKSDALRREREIKGFSREKKQEMIGG